MPPQAMYEYAAEAREVSRAAKRIGDPVAASYRPIDGKVCSRLVSACAA